MKKNILIFAMVTFVFLQCNLLFSKDKMIVVDAGDNKIINWKETKSVKLEGKVNPENIKVEWKCVNNPDVKFKNPLSPTTKAIFPRPGYYLLTLSTKGKPKVSSSVVVNVFKPNSYKERLNDLIKLMTIEEKISQLSQRADAIPRLGIPEYNYWNEALHGVMAEGATSFPQSIALGATWDPDLVYRVASAISDEARVLYKKIGKGLTYWSPTINIARDPRWGRNEESYSEDPYLLSRMAVAFVKGMQGDHPYYLKTVATPKHFIANNEEFRRHTGSSDVDMRNLFEYYLPAFKAAIVEGKAYSIMGAYNELNHTPCNASFFLMTDLLRKTWGFIGYVVSDCGAIADMVYGHKLFENPAEAVARSIRAGCDLNCGNMYREHLFKALELGLLEEKDIDTAVARVLSARFRLGEFDPPEYVPYSSIPVEELDCQEHRDLALEAARKSIVLLKNDGILPLDKNKIKSIAVIGPNAAEAQLGGYSGFPNILVSPLDGITEKAELYDIKVEYDMGCGIGGGLLNPIEPQYFSVVEGTNQRGLKGEYFDNMNLSGEPVITRIDPVVNFNSGGESPIKGLPKDRFSIRWTGKIIPPDTIHRIGTSCDDGSRLYLDGKLLIDDWTEHGERPIGVDVKLLPGREYEIKMEYFENRMGATARLAWDLGTKDFKKAKKVASRNDVVILVLGINQGISREELDRKEIELPKVQRRLITEVSKVNPNVIVVLVNGGPLALSGTEKKARAIVGAWYGGEMGGKALADVLFGDYNPSGKLPQTFYASTDQLPPMSDYDIINNPRTYMYFDKPVLFPFGHGLSYTTFEYKGLKFNSSKIKSDEEIKISFKVKNTGKLKGDEVVQVYVRAVDASFKVPKKQLKRFKRITLLPGKSEIIEFSIPADELSFYNTRTNRLEIFKGKWEIMIGSSSEDIRLKGDIFLE
ncbi:MAG: glycoside hydrolase family 3 C-terminal domain-containing protein [Candidatus Marinimicrobia bacterium]|nr:glycoside hydrolase family 3 C-terminal domain-containing protein [Candidatus Neomarinimicrobiota bacterium]